jgi:hypothetical protein
MTQNERSELPSPASWGDKGIRGTTEPGPAQMARRRFFVAG